MIGIYVVTNSINGKQYVGQSRNVRRRFWDHRCVSHETSPKLKEELIKFGKECFTYKLLEECQEDELDVKEVYWIKKLNPQYNTYNGGKKGFKVSEDVKQRLRAAGKAQWDKMSDEQKRKVIQNNLKGPRVGHEVSPETREKLRKANLGKKYSQESKDKRRATMNAKKANGYVRDGSGHFKSVICLDTGVVYESVKAAAKAIGARPSSVSAVLKGRQETTHGYHFEYWKCRD